MRTQTAWLDLLRSLLDSSLAGADVLEFGRAPGSMGEPLHALRPADALRHHRRFVRPGGHVAVTVSNNAHALVVRVTRWFSPETLATHNPSIMSIPAMRSASSDAGLTDGEVVGTTLLPEDRPWSSSVWAVGRVP